MTAILKTVKTESTDKYYLIGDFKGQVEIVFINGEFEECIYPSSNYTYTLQSAIKEEIKKIKEKYKHHW